MGLFQALLLAASLGWTVVIASPSPYGPYSYYSVISILTRCVDSSLAANDTTSTPWSVSHTGIEPTFKTLAPHLQQTAPSLSVPPTIVSGSMTANAPVIMSSAASLDTPPTYASPVTMITESSLQGPGGVQKPTSHAGQPGGTWQQPGGGGSPTTAAAETFYIHGSPVVAGVSPTVIAGTTYSIAASGGKVWVDGTKTGAKGIVSTPAPLASGTYTPVPATGGAEVVRVSGMVVGVLCGLVGMM
jgi:hypothetical protein